MLAHQAIIASELDGADYAADHHDAPASSVADWLALAAAPTFALLALLTFVLDGGGPQMLCFGGHDPSLFSGMIPMYVLMSVFHVGPWLRLIVGK